MAFKIKEQFKNITSNSNNTNKIVEECSQKTSKAPSQNQEERAISNIVKPPERKAKTRMASTKVMWVHFFMATIRYNKIDNKCLLNRGLHNSEILIGSQIIRMSIKT